MLFLLSHEDKKEAKTTYKVIFLLRYGAPFIGVSHIGILL